jgi:hypothetical protein
MSHGVEYTWKSLAEASDEATRKFAWIAAGLFIACAILAYLSISTYLAYSNTCAYINAHAPAVAVEQTDEADFARALLRNYCR